MKNHVASRTNGYKVVDRSAEAGNWKKSCSDLDTLVPLENRDSASGGICVL